MIMGVVSDGKVIFPPNILMPYCGDGQPQSAPLLMEPWRIEGCKGETFGSLKGVDTNKKGIGHEGVALNDEVWNGNKYLCQFFITRLAPRPL